MANDLHHHTTGFFKSNLFIFLLGQAFAFICWLLIIAGAYGRFDQKITEWEKWRVETQATITRMDSYGTNASKWSLDAEKVAIEKNSQRIDKLESQSITIISRLDVMTEKISRIDENVGDLKAKK